ncbi:hypothetical protein IAT38_000197 [Cryptococcus sp. DSM 104549]
MSSQPPPTTFLHALKLATLPTIPIPICTNEQSPSSPDTDEEAGSGTGVSSVASSVGSLGVDGAREVSSASAEGQAMPGPLDGMPSVYTTSEARCGLTVASATPTPATISSTTTTPLKACLTTAFTPARHRKLIIPEITITPPLIPPCTYPFPPCPYSINSPHSNPTHTHLTSTAISTPYPGNPHRPAIHPSLSPTEAFNLLLNHHLHRTPEEIALLCRLVDEGRGMLRVGWVGRGGRGEVSDDTERGRRRERGRGEGPRRVENEKAKMPGMVNRM